jgi:hypothetical protein
MEQRTKSFIWGVVVGAILLAVSIIGLVSYLYFKGTAISAEKAAQQEKSEAEQVQQFGTTCSNAVPEAMAYLLKTLAPTLRSHREERFNNEALSDLILGVESQAKFLSHCSTRVAFQSGNSLEHSNMLMSASNGFSNVYALLNGLRTGMRIDNCDQECHQDMVRRVTEEAAKLENVLRGRNEST